MSPKEGWESTIISKATTKITLKGKGNILFISKPPSMISKMKNAYYSIKSILRVAVKLPAWML